MIHSSFYTNQATLDSEVHNNSIHHQNEIPYTELLPSDLLLSISFKFDMSLQDHEINKIV